MVVTTQYVRQLSYICPVARHPVPAVTIWDLELEGLRRSARREGPSLGGRPSRLRPSRAIPDVPSACEGGAAMTAAAGRVIVWRMAPVPL
jgi:hypothetical protein